VLVLTRRINEKIYLFDEATGEEIAVISLREASTGRAKIGIVAPKGVNIAREELLPKGNNGTRRGEPRDRATTCAD